MAFKEEKKKKKKNEAKLFATSGVYQNKSSTSDDDNSCKSSGLADAAINYKQATDLKSLSWLITYSPSAKTRQSHLPHLTILTG